MVDYLSGYSEEFREQATRLKLSGRLEAGLLGRYPNGHEVTSNAALYTLAMDLKRKFLKSSVPLSKVRFSDKISTLHRAFGLHTFASRVQGGKLKAKNEIRIASLFKKLPLPFLTMVVVHELAHLRHKGHDKAFYRLCTHMDPDYHRHETDLRLLLYARQSS